MSYLIAFILGVLATFIAKIKSNNPTAVIDKRLELQVKSNEDAYDSWKKAHPSELDAVPTDSKPKGN